MNGWTDTLWIVAFVLSLLAALVAIMRRPGVGWLIDVLGWASVAFLVLGALAL